MTHMTDEEVDKLNPAERKLWDLREDLMQLADRFTKLGEQCYHGNKEYPCDRNVARICKAVDGTIGDGILDEIDAQMDWEEDD